MAGEQEVMTRDQFMGLSEQKKRNYMEDTLRTITAQRVEFISHFFEPTDPEWTHFEQEIEDNFKELNTTTKKKGGSRYKRTKRNKKHTSRSSRKTCKRS